jgi:hypothetical protein
MKLAIFVIQNEIENEKFTIIQGFKHHHHEIAGGKRQDVRL